MRVVKPQQLVFLKGGYKIGYQSYLGFSIVTGFYLSTEHHFASEAEIWDAWRLAPMSSPIFETSEPKPFAEYLLAGHAGIGRPVTNLDLSVSVGGLARKWHAIGEMSDSPPKRGSFTRLPLEHAQSYGGKGCEDNPLGRGFQEECTPLLMDVLQDGKLVENSPLAAPSPIPHDFACRKQYMDAVSSIMNSDEYREKIFPGYPDTIDPRYFQIAPSSQWYSEPAWPERVPFKLDGFRADKGSIEGEFPRVHARLLCITKDEPECIKEVLLKKKTLWLLPDSDMGLMIFTGSYPVEHLLSEPLSCVIAGLESQEAPRDIAYYQSVYAKRVAKESSDFVFLYDPDLMPKGMRMNVIGGMEQHPSSLRYTPGARYDDIAYFKEIRTQIAEHQKRQSAPEESAVKETDWASFPDTIIKSVDQIDFSASKGQVFEGDIFVFQNIEGISLDSLIFKKCIFSHCDFTQVTITKSQFEYCQFEDCRFSNVVYNKTKLCNVNFKESVFTHWLSNESYFDKVLFSKVTGMHIKHVGTEYLSCIYDDCRFTSIDFVDVDIRGGAFLQTTLSQTTFSRGSISDLTFDMSCFEAADFNAVTLKRSSVMNSHFSGGHFEHCEITSLTSSNESTFVGMKATESLFEKVGLLGVDMRGSDFRHCTFVSANFSGALLAATCFVQCDMPETNFKDASVENVKWVQSSVEKSLFYHALIQGAKFEHCNMLNANMSMVRGVNDCEIISCLQDDIIWLPKIQESESGGGMNARK